MKIVFLFTNKREEKYYVDNFYIKQYIKDNFRVVLFYTTITINGLFVKKHAFGVPGENVIRIK